MNVVRVVRSGRRHKIGNAHIRAAMANAGNPVEVQTEFGSQLHYVAADDRGVELHIIAVPDLRRPDRLAVIHAMPTSYTDRDDEQRGPMTQAQDEDLLDNSEGGAP